MYRLPDDTPTVYRILLRLYPKEHRSAYGRDMAQTFCDMLSDQPSGSGRLAIWLKVCIELPFNAAEEHIQHIGGISVQKLSKISPKQLLYSAGILLLLGSYTLFAVGYLTLRSDVRSLRQFTDQLNKNQIGQSGGGYNAVTIAPAENAVYVPQARLRLPATSQTETLVYGYSPDRKYEGSDKTFNAEVSFSTHDLSVNNFPLKQFDCTQVAYADFVTPSYPVNPMYVSNGSTKLADGRTLNVYYAKNIPGCEELWRYQDIDSKAIADALKQAASY